MIAKVVYDKYYDYINRKRNYNPKHLIMTSMNISKNDDNYTYKDSSHSGNKNCTNNG